MLKKDTELLNLIEECNGNPPLMQCQNFKVNPRSTSGKKMPITRLCMSSTQVMSYKNVLGENVKVPVARIFEYSHN